MLELCHIAAGNIADLEVINSDTIHNAVYDITDQRTIRIIVTDPSTKILYDTHQELRYEEKNICWYYDADFEFLNDPSIKRIVIGGVRALDLKLRLLIGGVPEEKIVCAMSETETPALLKLDADKIFEGEDADKVLFPSTCENLNLADEIIKSGNRRNDLLDLWYITKDKETIERVFADAKEKHAMRYTHHRGFMPKLPGLGMGRHGSSVGQAVCRPVG